MVGVLNSRERAPLRPGRCYAKDPEVTVSGDPAVVEGSPAVFTVSASDAPSSALTVNLTVSEAAGTDYVAAADEGSKTVTIPAGHTTATHSVPTRGDDADGTDGTVTVTVGTGTGYDVGTPASADVAVSNDDAVLSNTGQTGTDGTAPLDDDHFQRFTTGSHDWGYRLQHVDLELALSGTAPEFTVFIERVRDDANVGTLTQQGGLPASAGLVRFTAAGSGIELDHDTHYAVVLDVTKDPNASATVGHTTATAEDAASSTGWAVHDNRGHRDWNNAGAFTAVSNNPLKIALHAVEQPKPLTPPHPALGDPLVSNIGQTDDGTASFGNDLAQSFTTGNETGGYRLHGVAFDLEKDVNTVLPTYEVRIQKNTSSSRPGDVLRTLSQQRSVTRTARTVEFTAGLLGIDLEANTTYWAVIDVTGGAAGTTKVKRTSSNAENSGGAAGWSIGNSRLWRTAGSSSWESPVSTNVLQMAVYGGTVPDAPTLSTTAPPAITDKTLTLTFTGGALERSAVPEPSQFTAKIADRKVAVAAVALDATTVTLTLAEAAGAGQTVTVSYSQAGLGQLQGQFRNLVAEFTDQAVTNNSTNRAPVFTATATNLADEEVNAPAGTTISLGADRSGFSDPDEGDTLTFSASLSRDDTHSSFADRSGTGDPRIWFQSKDSCALANLEPPLPLVPTATPPSPQTTVTLTATDPSGATARLTRRFILASHSDADGLFCPALESAAVTDRTLTLTYKGGSAFPPSGLSASEFEVQVNDEVVALADTNPVMIGTPTTSGSRVTTDVTLTLARPAGRGLGVTASHTPGAAPTTVGFTNETVTNNTTNNAPTVTVANPNQLQANAPPATLVSARGITFADADGHALTITVTADRGDDAFVLKEYLDRPGDSHDGVYVMMAPVCDLRRIAGLPASFETRVTVTAEDPGGAVAEATMVVTTAWAAEDCPEFVSAALEGAALTLTYDEALKADSVPGPEHFAVSVNGAARALAAEDLNADPPVKPVAVAGSTAVLTLASPVAEGVPVNVSYSYYADEAHVLAEGTYTDYQDYLDEYWLGPPTLLRSEDHHAETFADRRVPNGEPQTPPVGGGEPPGPKRLAAMVRDATLTLVYESDLDTASTPAPGAFAVTVGGTARALAAEDLTADPPVKPVEVKDRRVVLTLSSAVGPTDAVRLTYTVPGANPIQDAAGEAAAGFQSLGVSNLAGDARSPRLVGAWVEKSTLTLVYDELLNPDAPGEPESFNVREVHANGSDRIRVDAVTVVGKRVVLTLRRNVDPERRVSLTYVAYESQGGNPIVQDFAGNVAGAISDPLAVVHGPPPAERPSTPPSSGGGPSGGGGGGGAEPRNAAPEASDPIGALTLGAGGAVGVDLSAHFTDPDGDELDFAAESSDPAVAAVEVDGAALTVRGLVPGTATVTVTATDPDGESATQSFAVTVTGTETVWHLPPASDPVLQGFVRVINHSDHAGTATVTATDDAGRTYEPLTLALERRGAAHFNVHDLESGNPAKGLTGATGPGTGGWRLAIESDSLAVEALAYARAADGFLTPLDGAAPRTADGALALATFNPGSNWRQVSLLRLVNPTEDDAEAAVAGTDDAGSSPSAPVRLTIPAGTACTVDAAELESGRGLACGASQAGLGDGTGKWRLRIESDAPLTALGLLRSPTGHLSNLSGGALAADADGVRRVLTFPSASDPDGRQGFVRFINRSDRDGTVTVRASDGTDADYEALTLALKAGQAAQFNSDDLELGNPGKGLSGSTGPGRGDWTLALSAEGIEFDAYAYVRSRRDGFLAPMGAAAPSRDADGDSLGRVAFLNPGSNWRQRSLLRLVNPGDGNAEVAIEGTDDTGLRPGSPVRLTVPAGGAIDLTSAELESGDAEAIESGALGDGKGKWRLRIESDTPIAAQSLATSPTGRLVNLSGADDSRGFRHGLLPPPGGVTLESPYECELLGRWDAAPGAPHAVDLLKDGERLAAHSAARWTHPTRRWAGLCGAGSYRIRVCALNADGDCGPWSDESNAVTVD